VHLYAGGVAELEIGGRRVELTVRTEYPWDGTVDIEVEPGGEATFALNLRIPGWCRQATLAVNGEDVEIGDVANDGYARIERCWKAGDRVRLVLNMPIERIRAHPAVRMANGKVALQKGPIVYCLEEVDNGIAPLGRIGLPTDAELEAEYRPDLLGGVEVIQGKGLMADDAGWEGALYSIEPAHEKICAIAAVPYCVWDNRKAGQMLVWLRESG